MRWLDPVSLLTVSLLLLAGAPRALAGDESSLRCPGGLVSLGDPKIDLLGKCGEPTLRELSQAETVGVVRSGPAAGGAAGAGSPITARRESSVIERWTYDFGRSQFVRIVTLDGGRVRAIETGGRGYREAEAHERRPLPMATCDYMGIRVGDRAYDLVSRCGEPATKDVRILERTREVVEGSATVTRTVTVPIEVWAYDFGPQTLVRIVELEDGRVVRVETGGHGYAP